MSWRQLTAVLGPGLVSGASDDDPSGVGTYAVAGASFGYALLWTAPAIFPLVAAVQLTCARVGLIGGMGLTAVLRRHYPRHLLYPAVLALLVANTVNAGADIGAIAAAINLLTPVPIPTALLVAPVALLLLALQVWGSYRVLARVFKWTTLVLFAYVGAGILAHPPLGEVLRATIIPTVRFDPSFLATVVALLGTTISPYLFFWQTSQEVEEDIHRGQRELASRRGATDEELRNAMIDTDVGMLLAVIVMYFAMLATAATLHAAGQTDVTSAADAARALRPLAGDAAAALMAIGLIGTGALAVPILTSSAAYAAAEALGWRAGLDERPRTASGFYAVIVLATLVGLAIPLLGINPIGALYWAAVLNGVLAPPLLALILLVANNPAVMGDQVNGRGLNVLGWLTVAVMTAAAIGLLASLVIG
jgi:NRAMP (natural resistance-associated macrophage protein)-like metal ion transporter